MDCHGMQRRHDTVKAPLTSSRPRARHPLLLCPTPARCEVTSRFACLMKLNRKFLVSQLWRWAINSRSPSEGTTEARGPMAWEGSWEGCPIDRSISGELTHWLGFVSCLSLFGRYSYCNRCILYVQFQAHTHGQSRSHGSLIVYLLHIYSVRFHLDLRSTITTSQYRAYGGSTASAIVTLPWAPGWQLALPALRSALVPVPVHTDRQVPCPVWCACSGAPCAPPPPPQFVILVPSISSRSLTGPTTVGNAMPWCRSPPHNRSLLQTCPLRCHELIFPAAE